MLTNVNGNELMSHQGWMDGWIYRETKQKKNRIG